MERILIDVPVHKLDKCRAW